MGKHYEATGITLETTRKRLTRAMVASYLKHHPGGHARVVTQGSLTWLKPDEGPSPSWSSGQLQEMRELAEEFDYGSDFPAEDAVLRWQVQGEAIQLWFEQKTDEIRNR
jgi:hypothetical protein